MCRWSLPGVGDHAMYQRSVSGVGGQCHYWSVSGVGDQCHYWLVSGIGGQCHYCSVSGVGNQCHYWSVSGVGDQCHYWSMSGVGDQCHYWSASGVGDQCQVTAISHYLSVSGVGDKCQVAVTSVRYQTTVVVDRCRMSVYWLLSDISHRFLIVSDRSVPGISTGQRPVSLLINARYQYRTATSVITDQCQVSVPDSDQCHHWSMPGISTGQRPVSSLINARYQYRTATSVITDQRMPGIGTGHRSQVPMISFRHHSAARFRYERSTSGPAASAIHMRIQHASVGTEKAPTHTVGIYKNRLIKLLTSFSCFSSNTLSCSPTRCRENKWPQRGEKRKEKSQ